ncbi:hypothetical protein FOA52_003385 [Chlamydomonas sp. UWO 241]|nr:hypothetical protein FOA52_003385 [Chlamydomonas sp. UWO 241]
MVTSGDSRMSATLPSIERRGHADGNTSVPDSPGSMDGRLGMRLGITLDHALTHEPAEGGKGTHGALAVALDSSARSSPLARTPTRVQDAPRPISVLLGGGGPEDEAAAARVEASLAGVKETLGRALGERRARNDAVAAALLAPRGGAQQAQQAQAQAQQQAQQQQQRPGGGATVAASGDVGGPSGGAVGSSGRRQSYLTASTSRPGSAGDGGRFAVRATATPGSTATSRPQQQQQHQHGGAAVFGAWLEDSLASLARGGGASAADGDAAPAPIELADSAAAVLQSALDDLNATLSSSDPTGRARLLAPLVAALSSTLEARAGLVAEARMAAIAGELAAVASAPSASGRAAAAPRSHAEAAAADDAGPGAGSSGLLHARLGAATASAEAMARERHLRDLELTGEVGRRAEAQRDCDRTHRLMSNTEHAWLRFRSDKEALRREVSSLRGALADVRAQLDDAHGATQAVRSELQSHLEAAAATEAGHRADKAEYRGDAVLLVSLRQQAIELSTSVDTLREHGRLAAAQTSDARSRTDASDADAAGARDEAAAAARARERADSDAALATAAMQDAQEQLRVAEFELADTRESLSSQLSDARSNIERLEGELSCTVEKLEATAAALEAKDAAWEEQRDEVEALREMVQDVSLFLHEAGVLGVPKPDDKAWERIGPLGATRKALIVAGRHIEMVMASLETSRAEAAELKEMVALQNKSVLQIQAESDAAKRAQDETLVARERTEAAMIRSEAARRDADAAHKKAAGALAVALQRNEGLAEATKKLQAQVTYMMPFEAKWKSASAAFKATAERAELLDKAYEESKADVTFLAASQEQFKQQVDKFAETNSGLVTQVRQIAVLQADLAEIQARYEEAVVDAADWRARASAAEVEGQELRSRLEMSRFFLQGLHPASSEAQITEALSRGASLLSSPLPSPSPRPHASMAWAGASGGGGGGGAQLRPCASIEAVEGASSAGGGGAQLRTYASTVAAGASGGDDGRDGGDVMFPLLARAPPPRPHTSPHTRSAGGAASPASSPFFPATAPPPDHSGHAPHPSTLTRARPRSSSLAPGASTSALNAQRSFSMASAALAPGTSSGGGGIYAAQLAHSLRPHHTGSVSGLFSDAHHSGGGGSDSELTSPAGYSNHFGASSSARPQSAMRPHGASLLLRQVTFNQQFQRAASDRGGAHATLDGGDLEHHQLGFVLSRLPSRSLQGSSGGGSPAPSRALRREPSGFVSDSLKRMVSGGLLIEQDATAVSAAAGVAEELEALDAKRHRWLNVRIALMGYFSGRLRRALIAEVEKREAVEVQLLHAQVEKREAVEEQLLHAQAVEVQLLHAQVAALEAHRNREAYISTHLVGSLYEALAGAKKEALREVSSLREFLPDMVAGMAGLGQHSTGLAFELQALKHRLSAGLSIGTQTGAALESEWARFMQALPRSPPEAQLSESALSEAIVRIYLRAVDSVEDVPVWGAERTDTVHDAIMAHYQGAAAPGLFCSEYLEDVEGPLGRLLRTARGTQTGSFKVSGFCAFLGVQASGVAWSQPAWHFFLHALHCVRLLMSSTWRDTARAWATPAGAALPVVAVLDLMGNLFNAQLPAELEGAISARLAAIMQPGKGGGHGGATVDLDALLWLLVCEFNAGNAPRSPLLFPRRITDGTLFNVFNAQSPVDAQSFLTAANAKNRPLPLPTPEEPALSKDWNGQLEKAAKQTVKHKFAAAGKGPQL